MQVAFTKAEALLLAACTALCALALFEPAVAQPLDAHAFADQRVLWGIPNALDVLLLEAYDPLVLEATGRLLSGHTLKHVAAALAAWPVIAALSTAGRRQNAQPATLAAA